MAYADSDFISKEQHELDYVLRKWGKRTTRANRTILEDALDRFSGDSAWAPFTRDLFYSYAEKTGLKAKLESADRSASAETGAEASAAPESAESTSNKTRVPWWIILVIVILVILLLALLVRTCSIPQPTPTTISSGTSSVLPEPAVMSSAPAAPAAPASAGENGADAADRGVQPRGAVSAPEPAARPLSLSDLPADSLAIRFEPNVTDTLQPAEMAKLKALAKTLAGFGSGTLTITGHSARIGYAEGERAVSLARARFVERYLRDAGVPQAITLDAGGKGSAEPISAANPAESLRLSRRVEIGVR